MSKTSVRRWVVVVVVAILSILAFIVVRTITYENSWANIVVSYHTSRDGSHVTDILVDCDSPRVWCDDEGR